MTLYFSISVLSSSYFDIQRHFSQQSQPLSPSAHQVPNKYLNIKDFGAIGDGQTNDTDSIQSAFNYISQHSNNILIFPTGRYLTWPLTLTDCQNTTLTFDFQAILQAPSMSFWSTPPPYAFIQISNCLNLIMNGPGSIYGNGSDWWNAFRKDKSLQRPHLISLKKCVNTSLKDLYLINSPKFNLVISKSSNIFISHLNIIAPSNSPNTDGIDPQDSQYISIENCYIANGDDGIAIKNGSQHMIIKQNTFLYGHGASIGSFIQTTKHNYNNSTYNNEHTNNNYKNYKNYSKNSNQNTDTNNGNGNGNNMNEGEIDQVQYFEIMNAQNPVIVNNISFINNIFINTTAAVRIKTYQGVLGQIKNIIYQGVNCSNVKRPIDITEWYCPNQPPDSCPPQQVNLKIANITLKDVFGTQNSGYAGVINCSFSQPCTGLYLDNIQLLPLEGVQQNLLLCAQAEGEIVDVVPSGCTLNREEIEIYQYK